MSFVPAGYMTSRSALLRLAMKEEPDEVQKLLGDWQQCSPTTFETAKSSRGVADPPPHIALRLDKLLTQVEPTLRQELHEGRISAVYFGQSGASTIPKSIWATAEANDVLVSAMYFRFGKPRSRNWYDPLPPHELVLLNEAELVRRLELRSEAAHEQPETASTQPRRVSAKKVRQALLRIADGEKTERMCKELVQAEVGPVPEKSVWRPAWASVPEQLKRPRGNAARNTAKLLRQ